MEESAGKGIFCLDFSRYYHLSQSKWYILDVFVAMVDFMILGSNSEILVRHGLLKFENCARRFLSEAMELET